VSTLLRIQRVLALLRDPRVAKLPRFAVLAAVAYLISPVDLVPEIAVPIVGWLDDATLIWMALRWLAKAGTDADQKATVLDVPTARRLD
jgi:uncharacterized membrane protein YkvA (DUF1232 family)